MDKQILLLSENNYARQHQDCEERILNQAGLCLKKIKFPITKMLVLMLLLFNPVLKNQDGVIELKKCSNGGSGLSKIVQIIKA